VGPSTGYAEVSLTAEEWKAGMKTRYVFNRTTVWRPGEPECSFETDGEDLEKSFRRVFHREMTPQEKRFFYLAEQLLRGEDREEAAMSCSAAEVSKKRLA
jgi:hypothetical protein